MHKTAKLKRRAKLIRKVRKLYAQGINRKQASTILGISIPSLSYLRKKGYIPQSPRSSGKGYKVSYEKVLEIRRKNPCATLQQIANEVGVITRERVRQILSSSGLPTIRITQKYLLYCPSCGEVWDSKKRKTCPKCPQRVDVPLVCDGCGSLFYRTLGEVKAHSKRGGDKVFCNKKCFGKYAGEHYGFAVHPENCGHPPTVPWDDIVVIREILQLPVQRISNFLGVPISSVCVVLHKAGCPRRYPSIPQYVQNRVPELRLSGMTYRKIGETLGISSASAFNIFRRGRYAH